MDKYGIDSIFFDYECYPAGDYESFFSDNVNKSYIHNFYIFLKENQIILKTEKKSVLGDVMLPILRRSDLNWSVFKELNEIKDLW